MHKATNSQLSRYLSHRCRRSDCLVRTLQRGLKGGASTAAGYLALGSVLLAAGKAEEALEAAKAGLKYVADRAAHGKERMKQARAVMAPFCSGATTCATCYFACC